VWQAKELGEKGVDSRQLKVERREAEAAEPEKDNAGSRNGGQDRGRCGDAEKRRRGGQVEGVAEFTTDVSTEVTWRQVKRRY
jgi:hypothetical protein